MVSANKGVVMDRENRVLAYGKAFELTDSELMNISGAANTMFTVRNTTQLTGIPPSDVTTIQVWD